MTNGVEDFSQVSAMYVSSFVKYWFKYFAFFFKFFWLLERKETVKTLSGGQDTVR